MLPSDLTLSALRFILSAKSRQSCKQDCETVDFCNSLIRIKGIEKNGCREEAAELSGRMRAIVCVMNRLNWHCLRGF